MRRWDARRFSATRSSVRGTLYGTSPLLKVFALDAATGRERWVFNPFAANANATASFGVNRGVVYWEAEGGGEARILVTAGERLFALDAATGRPIESFGRKGEVDLHDGFGRDVRTLSVRATTPGAIYRDLLILGSSLCEGPGPAAPGDIRAFDVRTGRVRWIFHTIPHPGELGHDTWPADAWTKARRRQLVERPERRRSARAGLRAHRIGGLRFLGRQPARRQSLCELAAGARGGHRRSRLALPVRPPRHLGSRPAAVARARDPAARRPQRRRGRAGDQERLRVSCSIARRARRCFRSRSGRRRAPT